MSVIRHSAKTIVVNLVLSRFDYGNSVLVGLPAYLCHRLQSVLNASERLICNLRRYDSVTALASLHWLSIEQRIKFKLAVLTYKVLRGTAPTYLGTLVRVRQTGKRSTGRQSRETILTAGAPFS